MERSTDLATLREESPEAAEGIDRLLPQLLITLIKRAGGEVEVPVAEVDDTGQDVLDMRIDQERRVFVFSTRKKQ